MSNDKKPVKILIIEDDPGLARLAQKRLERVGYRIDIALNGEEGLKMYKTGSYQAVAVDHNMPGDYSGLDVIRILGEEKQMVPVVMVTGSGDEKIAVEAMKLGAGDYIIKDVETSYIQLLPAVIEKLLSKKLLFEEKQQALKALQESEIRYRTLFDGVPVGLYRTKPDGQVLDVNQAFVEMLGYPDKEKLKAVNANDFYLNSKERKHWQDLIEKDKVVQGFEYQMLRYDGKTVWVLDNARIVNDDKGQILYYDGSLENITFRKQAEEKLKHLATHDVLTGLPNRKLFNDRIAIAITQAERHQQKLAVMLFDLDRFKDVNDTLGHKAGDLLLQAIGSRIENILRKGDTLARMGGDEFLILLAEIKGIKDADIIAKKIIAAFKEPFIINDEKLNITTSIGISIYPNNGEKGDTLIKNADIAMYSVKTHGRSGYKLYEK